MNKKNALLAFSVILFVAAAVLGISGLLKQMENPAICSKCHAMKPFYESYSDSENYVLIQTHKAEEISCIDCHSPPGRENWDKVRTTILKKMVSYVYIGNVTADTSMLKPDCTKCHDIDTTFSVTEINPHGGVQSCEVSCHLVHEDLILGDFVDMDCAECHVEPDVGGRHANVDCVGCHPTHGRIPSCTGCHAAHDGSKVKVENSECLECHGVSAHTIAVVTYDASSTIPTTTCGACHGEQYTKFGNSMHGNMESCVGCHSSHGQINPCLDCHYSNHMGAHSLLDECLACHNVGGGIHKACIDCHIQDPHTI